MYTTLKDVYGLSSMVYTYVSANYAVFQSIDVSLACVVVALYACYEKYPKSLKQHYYSTTGISLHHMANDCLIQTFENLCTPLFFH